MTGPVNPFSLTIWSYYFQNVLYLFVVGITLDNYAIPEANVIINHASHSSLAILQFIANYTIANNVDHMATNSTWLHIVGNNAFCITVRNGKRILHIVIGDKNPNSLLF